MTNKEKQEWLKYKYPLTIITDRYDGTYSGGGWLAFPLYCDEIPSAVYGYDEECAAFWANNLEPVGKGNSAQTALDDLISQMKSNVIIDVPFGAQDSELKGWEYTIPEGMEAIVQDGKVVVRQKESEDERIRKAIVCGMNALKEQKKETFAAVPINDCLAWLEKQKEQKPRLIGEDSVEKKARQMYETGQTIEEQKPVCESDFKWTSQDERCRSKLIDVLELADAAYPTTKDSRDELWEWLKELPMKFPNKNAFIAGTLDNDDEWLQTEEILGPDGNPTCYKQKPSWSEEDDEIRANRIYLKGYNDAVRNLKPAEWKPSEEQIYSLGTVVKGYDECTVGSVGYNLKELYEHLKKL